MTSPKTSTLIRNGLFYLWDGTDISEVRGERQEEYLCHAIIRAARGGVYEWMLPKHRAMPSVEAKLDEVKDMIEKRLFPWNNLYAWLHYRASVPESCLTDLNLQKHRKQWAELLIAEFKLKGD